MQCLIDIYNYLVQPQSNQFWEQLTQSLKMLLF